MSQFNQESVQKEYNSFVKRNKVARERYAQKKGYSSAEAYLAFLKGALAAFKGVEPKGKKTSTKKGNVKAKKKKQPVKDIVIHNAHLLDASGSMSGSKLDNALKGINGEVSELKLDKSTTYIHSFISFSGRNDIRKHENRTPIKLVPKIKINSRGMTALYQAIVETLNGIIAGAKPNEKTILKIFTDGGENNSDKSIYSADVVSETIKRAEAAGVTVTFVGTKTDVDGLLSKISSLRASNTLTHTNTAESVATSFKISGSATKTYVNKAKAGEAVLDGFYKQEGTL